MNSRKNAKKDIEILIAEDSATQREQLEHLLRERGYAVVAAADGREALAAARRRKPALIVTDVLMPELDGYDLCKAVKADDRLKDVPMVLLTTLADPLDVIRGLECGADNFIRKPYESDYLFSRIEYLLMNRELRKSQKMQIGVEIKLGDNKYFVTAERQQMLDLLISTYEQAVQINDELKLREKDLAQSNRVLNALYRVAEALNQARSEGEVAESALERALELPGIQAGWISLREGEAGFRLAASRNLPPALDAPGAFEGDCDCRRRLLAGELDSVTNILECERLAKLPGGTRGLRYHAAVPLWLGDRTLGVMNLVGPEKGLFTDGELQILHGVGNQVALALERARLHGNLERMVAERTAKLEAEMADRRRIEKDQARLVAIIEATPDFVATGNLEGRVFYVNQAGLRMIGCEPGQDVSKLQLGTGHPAWALKRVLETGIPHAIEHGTWSGETAFVRPDGSEIPLSQVIVAHKGPDGSVEFLSTIGRDITERKRAEEAQGRLAAIVEGSEDAIVSRDMQRRVTTWNAAAERLFGYAAEEVVGRTIDFIIPPDQEAQAARMRALLARGIKVAPYDTVRLAKGGGRIDVSLTQSPIRDASGKMVGVSLTFRDITERKRAEAAQGRLAAIVEDSEDAIISRDLEQRVVSWNAAAERLFGYAAQEVIGRRIDFFIPPDQQAQVERMRALLAEGKHIPPYETVRLAKDGRRIDVLHTLSPIRDASEQVIGASLTIRDITERRQLEQQLRQSRKMQAVGQLTGGVAHDFNNLLGVILGNLDLLERAVAGNENALKRVATAQKAATRGADLTRRLLAFSRRQPLKAEAVELAGCVANVIEMARRTIGPDIEIKTAVGAELPAVQADVSGLESVLLNLMINSRDAMPQGGTIAVAARVAELDERYPGVKAGELPAGRYMCVTLSDTGQGMTPEVLERAFEPFFTTKERGKGTGLGLAMVYGFAKQSGGHVSLYSEPGHGTTVKLYLPLAEAAGEAAEAPQAEGSHERIDATALVVDDEADLLEVAAAYLEEMGFRVLQATNGPGALELLGREPAIELLLTDIMMAGGMNGVELARRARAARPGIRVLYSTGFSSMMLDEKVGTAVDSAVLSKPYRRAEFFSAIRKAMSAGAAGSGSRRQVD